MIATHAGPHLPNRKGRPVKPITITNVKTILTAPAGIRLVVVKVETSEPGLYGLGCATFTQRYQAVATAIDRHLAPFVIGKEVHRIEDIFQTAMVNAYWRNGPVMNNAISGIDIALWDIIGKASGQPVYKLQAPRRQVPAGRRGLCQLDEARHDPA